MASDDSKLLIQGGLVYDHDGDPHKPAAADILIEGAVIAAVGPDLSAAQTRGAEVIDASNHLVIPGLINAHYHSHDTLCRGLFEEMPLEFWLLYTLPMGGNRSKEEVRLRTLVGALESMRCGITTVQERKERQMEGIAKAKERGVYKGRKATIDLAKVKELRDGGLGASAIAEKMGICRASVYRALQQ